MAGAANTSAYAGARRKAWGLSQWRYPHEQAQRCSAHWPQLSLGTCDFDRFDSTGLANPQVRERWRDLR